jgi:membrane protein
MAMPRAKVPKIPEARAILKETLAGWWEDKAPRLGASLAYYTILALAPLVILVTPVAELLFGNDAQQEVVSEVAQMIGKQGADAVRDVLLQVRYKFRPGPAAKLFGLAVLLFGASGVFAELQDALDTIWEVTPKPGRAAVWSFVRQRLVSFAMVLGTGFLLIVSLLFSTLLARLREYADERLREYALLWTVLGGLISFGVITVLFAMIFKVLPDVKMPWRGVWIGAALTSVLFGVGRFLIGMYLGRASIGTAYGAAGSLVVLLVWIYYSSQILYLGAEFTKAYTRRAGARAVPTEDAVPVTEEARAQQGITHQAVVEAVAQVVEEKAHEQEAAGAGPATPSAALEAIDRDPDPTNPTRWRQE